MDKQLIIADTYFLPCTIKRKRCCIDGGIGKRKPREKEGGDTADFSLLFLIYLSSSQVLLIPLDSKLDAVLEAVIGIVAEEFSRF